MVHQTKYVEIHTTIDMSWYPQMTQQFVALSYTFKTSWSNQSFVMYGWQAFLSLSSWSWNNHLVTEWHSTHYSWYELSYRVNHTELCLIPTPLMRNGVLAHCNFWKKAKKKIYKLNKSTLLTKGAFCRVQPCMVIVSLL